MEEYKHWADALEIGDRAFATIRHKTDGSKNIHDAIVVIAENDRKSKTVIAGFNNKSYKIAYNDLEFHDDDFFHRHLNRINKIKLQSKLMAARGPKN